VKHSVTRASGRFEVIERFTWNTRERADNGFRWCRTNPLEEGTSIAGPSRGLAEGNVSRGTLVHFGRLALQARQSAEVG